MVINLSVVIPLFDGTVQISQYLHINFMVVERLDWFTSAFLGNIPVAQWEDLFEDHRIQKVEHLVVIINTRLPLFNLSHEFTDYHLIRLKMRIFFRGTLYILSQRFNLGLRFPFKPIDELHYICTGCNLFCESELVR
jgi:hypothetical protein